MKILAVNLSHHPSITQVTDDKIDFHIDESSIYRIVTLFFEYRFTF